MRIPNMCLVFEIGQWESGFYRRRTEPQPSITILVYILYRHTMNRKLIFFTYQGLRQIYRRATCFCQMIELPQESWSCMLKKIIIILKG